MTEAVVSATAFEAERGALMRLAYRMLGTRSDAEDMVQETYLRAERLARVPDNLPAWLTRTIYVACGTMRAGMGGRRVVGFLIWALPDVR